MEREVQHARLQQNVESNASWPEDQCEGWGVYATSSFVDPPYALEA